MQPLRTSTRNLGLFAALLAAPTLTACKSAVDEAPKAKVEPAGPAEPAQAEEEAKPETAAAPSAGLQVDLASSRIGFIGAKVTADHEGSFAEFTGEAVLDGDTPKSVAFSVTTASVDIEPGMLAKHLKSDDFFGVDEFPTASFSSTAITAKAAGDATHEITGELELRGVKKTISFPAKITVDAQKAHGSAEFSINRKDFGIEYAGMKDDLIKDDVVLKLDLSFPRA